ncbi:MAG TPA: DNA repair protein RecN [Caulobacteraceae bacterium]|nr:DNA repair protein RecN [Caulobacteraceae bacterium]
MLLGLAIRDLVLIQGVELAFGPGLTVLTGETGAGKSIVIGALGLACGARADAEKVRVGAPAASVAAVFAPPSGHPAWSLLVDKGLPGQPGEDLILRRTVGADGRGRAFVNDATASAATLKEIGALLVETHGQHEAVGLLDGRTHRALLDGFGGLEGAAGEVAAGWSAWREAEKTAARSHESRRRAAERQGEITERLKELDRLAPRHGEEQRLANERALLGAAEKALADIEAARNAIGGDDADRGWAGAASALGRARERARAAGADPASDPSARLAVAQEATERALVEIREAEAAMTAAARAFSFEPQDLERAEERLFAIRALARRLEATPDELPLLRQRLSEELAAIEDADEDARKAGARAAAALTGYDLAAQRLSARRRAAAEALTKAVQAELAPLKLDKARFFATVEPLAPDRAGPAGKDKVEFLFAGLPGAAPGPLAAIASGGELARLSLALKVCLAHAADAPAVMIFDEVDVGIGGAAADAVGQRLKRLARDAQVLVVTHSPQIAARADAHWRVVRDGAAARIEVLEGVAREEEIARMLSGRTVTEAARAAARALMAA